MLRIDHGVSEGITRAAREQNANLILMGCSRRGFRARLFGILMDDGHPAPCSCSLHPYRCHRRLQSRTDQGDDRWPPIPWEIQTLDGEDPADLLLHTAQGYDLVVLCSMRRRTVGGLAVSDVIVAFDKHETP